MSENQLLDILQELKEIKILLKELSRKEHRDLREEVARKTYYSADEARTKFLMHEGDF